MPPSLPHLTDSRLIWEDYVNGGFSLLPHCSLPCFTPNRASQFLRHARRRSRQRGQWWAGGRRQKALLRARSGVLRFFTLYFGQLICSQCLPCWSIGKVGEGIKRGIPSNGEGITEGSREREGRCHLKTSRSSAVIGS